MELHEGQYIEYVWQLNPEAASYTPGRIVSLTSRGALVRLSEVSTNVQLIAPEKLLSSVSLPGLNQLYTTQDKSSFWHPIGALRPSPPLEPVKFCPGAAVDALHHGIWWPCLVAAVHLDGNVELLDQGDTELCPSKQRPEDSTKHRSPCRYTTVLQSQKNRLQKKLQLPPRTAALVSCGPLPYCLDLLKLPVRVSSTCPQDSWPFYTL